MMKKVFLDTNILIDYLARRGQFFEPAARRSCALSNPCRMSTAVSYLKSLLR